MGGKRSIISLIIVCLIGCMLCGCDKKQDTEKEIGKNAPKIVVGSDNYPPFNYMDENGNPTGIDVDIVFAHKAEKAYAHGLGQFHRGQRRRARSHKQTHAADRGLFEHVHRQTPAEDHELALRGHALKLHGPYELVQSVVPGYVFIKQQNALRGRQGAAVSGPSLPKQRAAFFKGRL